MFTVPGVLAYYILPNTYTPLPIHISLCICVCVCKCSPTLSLPFCFYFSCPFLARTLHFASTTLVFFFIGGQIEWNGRE